MWTCHTSSDYCEILQKYRQYLPSGNCWSCHIRVILYDFILFFSVCMYISVCELKLFPALKTFSKRARTPTHCCCNNKYMPLLYVWQFVYLLPTACANLIDTNNSIISIFLLPLPLFHQITNTSGEWKKKKLK